MNYLLRSFVIFNENLGRIIIKNVAGLGTIMNFIVNFFYWASRKPYRFKLFFEQMDFIGNKSLFIIFLAGSFTGMVMAYQTYFGFKLINVDSLVGPVVAITLAKELAPVLTGLIVAGRAGAAMAAQIGTMKVTEQIDALEVMGISSVQFLAVPRIVAGTLSLPLLSIFFLLVGNIGSYIVGTVALKIDDAIYLSKLGQFMYVSDIFQGIIKAIVFGFVISVIGTYFGFSVTKGAQGVGKGTNLAVVWGMISVLVLDYFLTSFLVQVM
ncbi:ABC transporter permease [Halobacteriovorax sp. XZX-3]|uniref:MlaE family ABC transporter permease n=1 Tax=unclassified Halobacteriovorax TaxID=2639665 RepID=UPI000CCFDAAB|nr:ABC transporter permease [Halobacteriovorax sp. DA5]POB13992.1 ABC transporter permease [Halobacteriovorax sp. DA5]